MTDTIIVKNMLYIVSIMLAWILNQLGMHDVSVAVIIITLTCNIIMNIYWLWKESNSIDDDDEDD